MARPVVLVATTDPAMAYALQASLEKPCRELGLRLDICPGGDKKEDKASEAGDLGFGVCAYYSAEVLFDELEKRDPYELADTLVVLDVGAGLENAFSPKASTDDAWHVTANRAGVAVELLLRFPQVFPVFLSPAVPVLRPPVSPNDKQTVSGNGDKSRTLPVIPESAIDIAGGKLGEGNWPSYSRLIDALSTRHAGEDETVEGKGLQKNISLDTLFALTTPLHFVSPLDRGDGLASVLHRFARGMRCWFDPTGLRTLVKNRFLGTVFGSDASWAKASQREEMLHGLEHEAVAIDEEREFALLSAYTAWKYGRRAWVVTTYKEFHENTLWVASATSTRCDVIVLRDVDIRFPDMPEGKSGQSMRTEIMNINSSQWNGKLGGSWGAKAISGEASVIPWSEKNEWEDWASSEKGFGQRQNSKGEWEYLGFPKPVTSIYELREVLPYKVHGVEGKPQTILSKLGGSDANQESEGGHGAPYLNLAMGEALLRHSANCKDSPSAHFIGALLAMEAYELLLGMSKTTALEALLALHKHEVAAEVNFPGISQSLNIDNRKKDIEQTLNKLYEKKDGKQERETDLVKKMFLTQFWAELRIQYKDGEQFEAAEEANIQSLLNMSWKPKGWQWLSVGLSQCVKEWILRTATSLRWWVISAVGFSLVFAVLYGWQFLCDPLNFLRIWSQVILAMIQMQFNDPSLKVVVYPDGHGPWAHLLAIMHLGISYVLFGFLIAMIYRKITRA